MRSLLFVICTLIVIATSNRAFADSPYTYTVDDSQATIRGFDPWYSGALSITNTLGGYPVTTIGPMAFVSCAYVTSVDIPASVTRIGNYAFSDCSGLTRITIPGSVTNIRFSAFSHCPGLARLYFSGTPPALGSNVFDSTPASIYYPPAYANHWGPIFGGRPAKLWNPRFAATRLAADVVSCTVTGTPDIPISFEATTNLSVGPWLRLQTNSLPSGSATLLDPDSVNQSNRFYRITGP